MNCYPVFTCSVVALFLCATAQAQAQNRPDFLALDVFGGLAGLGRSAAPTGQEQKGAIGWNVGTTVRFLPWLGLKGELARTHDDYDGRQVQYAGGVEVASPYDGEFATRSFAHALTGSVGHHAWDGSSDRGPELVFGGGVDTLGFFRMQFDYVRMNVIGLPKNNARIYFGGVLPLCVTGCRDEDKDGIRVGNP